MKTKRCSNKKCKQPIKSISDFSKNKIRKDELQNWCNICLKIYRDKNKEKITKQKKKHYKENKDQISKQNKKKYQENKEIILERNRKRYQKIKVERIKQVTIYRIAHKENRNKQHNKRYHSDDLYKIIHNLRRRIHMVLKNNSKSKRTLELLGCTVEEVKQHLQSQFKSGMSWDNYGVHGWHIDHKKPCAKFDLSDPKQQELCFHYTNLQPLWAIDNLKKGSSYAKK